MRTIPTIISWAIITVGVVVLILWGNGTDIDTSVEPRTAPVAETITSCAGPASVWQSPIGPLTIRSCGTDPVRFGGQP